MIDDVCNRCTTHAQTEMTPAHRKPPGRPDITAVLPDGWSPAPTPGSQRRSMAQLAGNLLRAAGTRSPAGRSAGAGRPGRGGSGGAGPPRPAHRRAGDKE
ncbi:unnamed protein product [Boreogadus saida]